MPMSRRAFLPGMALTGAALVAARPFSAFAADNNTIVVSQGSDVLTLDPMLDTSPIGVNVFRNVFDALTRIEADGSVTPLLAVSCLELQASARRDEVAGQDLHQQAHVS